MLRFSIGLCVLIGVQACNSSSTQPAGGASKGSEDAGAKGNGIKLSDVESIIVRDEGGRDSCDDGKSIEIKKGELSEERLAKFKKISISPVQPRENDLCGFSGFTLEIKYGDGSKKVYASGDKCNDNADGVASEKDLEALFEFIDPKLIEESNYRYRKDDRGLIYYYSSALSAEPIADFKIINNTYSQSSSAAWYESEAINGVDAASFKAIDETFAKDANKVYVRGLAIAGASVADFAIQKDSLYSTSQGKVFFEDKVLADVSPATINVLNKDHLKDGAKVYFKDKIIEGADAASFEVKKCPEADDFYLKPQLGLMCSPSYDFKGSCAADKDREYLDGAPRKK